METLNFNGKEVALVISGDNWEGFRPLGHVYPDFQGRACPLADGSGFIIVDETGWDGYQEYDRTVMEEEGIFASFDEAMARIRAICSEYEEYEEKRYA